MRSSDTAAFEATQGVSHWLAPGLAPIVIFGAYLGGLDLSFTETLRLGLSVFFAGLLGRYQGTIPRTSIRVAPSEALIFWGIINWGVAGGCLVAIAAALARISDNRKEALKWGFSAAMSVAAAVAGGLAFSMTLDLSSRPLSPMPALGGAVPNEALAASGAMVAASIAVHECFARLVSLVQRSEEPAERWLKLRHSSVSGLSVAGITALLTHAAFVHFGDAFGLVIVPMVLLGNAAYQIHLRRLAQKTKEIVEASRIHLATVEALATAIDARDQVGIGHVRRTQIYAVGIGAAMGLGDSDLNALRAAALLHDIGKLAVPEHILNKPGRLTSAELERTKVHSTIGASILEKVGFPYPVVPTVRHHHESWDGSGYPDGLCGEDIPLTARILAVADAFDALRGARPYRAAISREDSCGFLRARAGTQFDPKVVDTFLQNLGRLEAEVEIHGFGYDTDAEDLAQRGALASNFVEQIKRANQEVFSLYEMARDFGSSMSLDGSLNLLTTKLKEFVPYDTCLVYLLDEADGSATAAHVEGKNREILLNKRLAIGEGASGYVLKKRKPVENVDPSLDFAFSHPDICDHYIGMACVPLMADEKLIGAVSVFSGKLAMYGEEHLRLLETISRIAADAIAKSIRDAENEIIALTDPLSGLPNARGLQLQFAKEVGRARRSGNPFQLLMLDLDGFKPVNDTFGHKAGDSLLKEIARIIKRELRDYDFLARYGGDEFVALVPETDSSDVIELCGRIEAAVGSFSMSFGGTNVSVGVSVGSACFPMQSESFEDLMIAADRAMYRTKAFHRQRRSRLGDRVEYEHSPLISLQETGISAGAPPPAEIIPDVPDLVVELDESHIVTVDTVS